LAGVSKRTVDYYTNIGLLTPLPSEKKYRYYSEETLARLKLIESMKKQRFTLEEIKQQLDLLDVEKADSSASLHLLKGQMKQLEGQLVQLQEAMVNLDPNKSTAATKQLLFQGMTLVQSLMLYLEEITSLL